MSVNQFFSGSLQCSSPRRLHGTAGAGRPAPCGIYDPDGAGYFSEGAGLTSDFRMLTECNGTGLAGHRTKKSTTSLADAGVK